MIIEIKNDACLLKNSSFTHHTKKMGKVIFCLFYEEQRAPGFHYRSVLLPAIPP